MVRHAPCSPAWRLVSAILLAVVAGSSAIFAYDVGHRRNGWQCLGISVSIKITRVDDGLTCWITENGDRKPRLQRPDDHTMPRRNELAIGPEL